MSAAADPNFDYESIDWDEVLRRLGEQVNPDMSGLTNPVFGGTATNPGAGAYYPGSNLPKTYEGMKEEAMKENYFVDRPYSEFWMQQGKDVWNDAMAFGKDGPKYFEWNQEAPTWEGGDRPTFDGIPEADYSGYMGPDAVARFQGMAKNGMIDFATAKSMFDSYLKNAPGQDYKGWQDVGVDPFNADQAFNTYMTGANERFNSTLADQLRTLSQTAAGRGRLNTGFFDLDTGDLGRQLSSDFRADTMMKALDTNRQQLDYILGKADVGLQNQRGRLDAYDTGSRIGSTNASAFAGMLGDWQGINMRGNELGADLLSGEREFSQSAWKDKYNMAKDVYQSKGDQYDAKYDQFKDKRTWYGEDRDFALKADTVNYGRWGEHRDWLSDQAETANENALNWRDRYWDNTTGFRQETLGKEEAAKDRKLQKSVAKANMWGNIIGGALGAAGKFIPG